jgi:predicted TIM-barrel fold metal-dependent hydrolase
MLYGINRRQLEGSIDQDWAERLSRLVAESDLDLAAVLGFDGVYDSTGVVDLSRSQMIVPLEWVFGVCSRHPNLLPAPSINPYRRDAIEVLEQAIELGAVLIKWLPIVQGFDPGSERIRPFLRRVADAGIPILIHAGTGEGTFAVVDPTVGDLGRIIPALEMGVRLICAHGAAPILFSSQPSQVPLLRQLLEKYENLWVDNSGLANPARFRYLPAFANDPIFHSRTLHGSDFPVITDAIYYPRRLGPGQVLRIQRETNRIQRDVLIKRALRYDEACLTRAAGVLANLDRWCPAEL